MAAVDPTYPLYPIACTLASLMLSFVLMTSFVRQKWNLGVAFLCFWLFLEHLTCAIDAIIWSDNADIKLYVYCDIVARLQFISSVVKPMATLLIARRLYLIANLEAVDLPSRSARRWDLAVEWTLGLIIPLLVAGPIYYVNQGARFEVIEGFGCAVAESASILDVLISQSWSVIPPLVSVIFYYPKVMRTYYLQRKDINSFLHSNPSVSRANYLRILALGSIDLLLTLPIGIASITLAIIKPLAIDSFPFYQGWTILHTEWEPFSISYVELQTSGTAELAQVYFGHWASPVLAFTIFGLFGLTSEARASYWRIICIVGGWFGWTYSPRSRTGRMSLGEIEFGARPRDTGTSGFDLEMGSRNPSFVNMAAPATNQAMGRTSGEGTARRSEVDLKSIDEGRRDSERINGPDIQIVGHRVSADEELSGAH